MFLKNKQKGFSLLEVLIYITVLAILILAIFAFLNWTTKSLGKSRAVKDVSDNVRMAMETITYEIREAKSIYTPTSGSSQLSLEAFHHLPTDEIYSYIDFYLCGATLKSICFKKEGENTTVLTAENIEVSNLEFILIGISSVAITIEANYLNPNNRPELQTPITLTSSASLRSY